MNAELEEVADDAPSQSAPSAKKKKKKKKKKPSALREPTAESAAADMGEASNMQAMNELDDEERIRELEE